MFTVLAYLFWMASVGICQMGNSRVHKKPGKVNALHIVALTLFLASMLCFFEAVSQHKADFEAISRHKVSN